MKPGFSLYILPTLLYVAVIFWLGGAPLNVEVPHGFVPEDKLKHFVAFGLLVLMLLRTLRFQWPSEPLGRLVLLSISGSSGIGALLEAWQALFPYRSSEFSDWVADTLGALLAGLLLFLHFRRQRRAGPREALDSPTQAP